jgi:hypothetical protein
VLQGSRVFEPLMLLPLCYYSCRSPTRRAFCCTASRLLSVVAAALDSVSSTTVCRLRRSTRRCTSSLGCVRFADHHRMHAPACAGPWEDAPLTISPLLTFAVWHGEGQDHGAQAAKGAQESYEEGAQPASNLRRPRCLLHPSYTSRRIDRAPASPVPQIRGIKKSKVGS